MHTILLKLFWLVLINLEVLAAGLMSEERITRHLKRAKTQDVSKSEKKKG